MCPIPPDPDAAPRAPEDGAPLDAVADQPSEAAPHGMPARVLEREAVRLHARYPEVGDVATARTVLAESYATLSATSRHPEMLATTSVRHAADRLRAMAIAQGSIESRHPRVLFVCHGNAGRSQMAAALLENRSAGAVKARSAGTSPAGEIIPTALDAMTEAGIPLHHAYPKGLDEDVLRTTELVVLFDGADPFEIPAGAEVRRWSVPSIRGLGIEQVRSVRDALDLQVRELIADLEERAAA
ncbi:protein-tyrosine-phosphatase [Micrococcus sp. 2A]|uniref:arsenate-mycothiol transferase ArsC n=1 Tax=Micrococcus sp. 2A TaxID=3142261 RepID=UPI002618230A|nr:protein-tyrosine-phosphatase [uncultured Micrococcus sp.]